MADCGATGTALDRAVAAATGNTSAAASKQAVASLVGHASMSTTGSAASMPATPPMFLSTSNVATMPASVAVHPSPELHQRPVMGFQHHAAPPHLRSAAVPHHPYAAMQQQQQQHHMMMQQQQMLMMQQQQQQQILMMQHQQQEQSSALEASNLKDDSDYDAKTQHASNKDPEFEQHIDVNEWHEGLDDDVEEAVQGHEGWVQGATIEELAAAWAQAEAEYEEYVPKQ